MEQAGCLLNIRVKGPGQLQVMVHPDDEAALSQLDELPLFRARSKPIVIVNAEQGAIAYAFGKHNLRALQLKVSKLDGRKTVSDDGQSGWIIFRLVTPMP